MCVLLKFFKSFNDIYLLLKTIFFFYEHQFLPMMFVCKIHWLKLSRKDANITNLIHSSLKCYFSIIFHFISATETATTPNADAAELLCDAGQYITITKAIYGDTANNCYDVNAFSIVQSSCNNKVTCSINVDSATFPDSTCSPTGSEGLSVAYSCTQGNT